ncbi:response regulator [Vulcaniibacterium gelatinicum]|uniref:response regulator n=1 Tax=Vulcaniibacterium gelatinicum TaxID=2598725 RepID=UPI0015F2B126|nr:response regulator [Vulcaniibacterium gelatinicum]
MPRLLLLWHPHLMLRDALHDWLLHEFGDAVAVGVAADPVDLLEQARTRAPSAVLVDVDALHGVGLTLLRSLQQLASPPPTVAMSVYQSDEVRQAAAEAGARACVCLMQPDEGLRLALAPLLLGAAP